MRRRTAFRISAWVTAALLAFTGVSVAYPGGVVGLVHDVCCHEQYVGQIKEAKSSGQQIDTAIRTRADRVRSLDGLSSALADGTVRLRNAADFYLSVVSAEPTFFDQYRNSLPGSSDLERVAVALLRAAFSTPHSASSRQSLLTQFHAEFGSEYPLPLPPPAESRLTSDHNTHP